jgi:tetratricopeptide (TPR) repeat protein
MMTYMTEYSLFKLNPLVYHITNLLFHIANVVLVFFLIRSLGGTWLVGFLVAMLFAVHPLRVESVAWIAERKDVVSAFFYFISLLAYGAFRKKGMQRYYILCMVAFVVSLLSKPMAVSLPFVLLLMDYLQDGKIGRKNILKKTPFFAVAGLFAIIAYTTVGDKNVHFPLYTPVQRILAPFYEVFFYLVKTIAPVKLSALYHFGHWNSATITLAMVASAILVVALAALVYQFRKRSRIIVFGTLFFLVTILPVLQVVTSGGWTIVADRYTYIPMIGLYLVFAQFCRHLLGVKLRDKKVFRVSLVAFLVMMAVWLCFLTLTRCGVWKNSISLWNDVVAKDPSAMAYVNRGMAYKEKNEFVLALADYNSAESLDHNDVRIFNDRGVVYYAKGDPDRANQEYERAIALDPGYSLAYNNRGVLRVAKGDYKLAIGDFERSVTLDPKYVQAYCHLGGAYWHEGDFLHSLENYTKAILLDPTCPEAHFGCALVFCYNNNLDRALEEFNTAIKFNPQYAEAYHNRGVAHMERGDVGQGISDFNTAISINPQYGQAYYSRALAYRDKGELLLANDDLKKACGLGISSACNLF